MLTKNMNKKQKRGWPTTDYPLFYINLVLDKNVSDGH